MEKGYLTLGLLIVQILIFTATLLSQKWDKKSVHYFMNGFFLIACFKRFLHRDFLLKKIRFLRCWWLCSEPCLLWRQVGYK